MKRIFWIPLVAVLVISCESTVVTRQATKGYIDLSEHSFTRPVSLEGQWEFYWGALLYPVDFIRDSVPATRYADIPHNWKKDKIPGIELSNTGNATYRLRIKTSGLERRFGIHLPRISTAYRLFVNGEEILERGKVEEDYRLSRGLLDVRTVYVYTDSPDIDIIIQVSNAFYSNAGITDGIILGSQETVQSTKKWAHGRDMFSIGFIVFAAVCFLLLFALRRKEKSSLYFGFFCLIIAFRTAMVTGERILYDYIPLTNLRCIEILQSITIYTLLPIFIGFIATRFPVGVKKRLVAFLQISSLVYLGVMVFIDPRYAEKVLLFYYPVVLLGIIYIFIIIICSLLHNRKETLLDSIGVFFIVMAAVFDILVDRDLFQSDYVLTWALLIFITFQFFLFARRFALTLKQEEQLTAHLNKVRDNLEQMVDTRTSDLKNANRDLDLARRKAEEANRAKSTFLTNMSHEMRTPLNGIIGNTELLLTSDRDSLEDYSYKILNESQHLLFLINQLLDLSKIEAGKMKLERHPFSLRDILSSVEDLLKPLVQRKNLSYRTFVSDSVPDSLLGDAERLRQIIINIAGNAVKFTNEGSVTTHVELLEKRNNTFILSFRITDTGIGMSEELRKKVFHVFTQGDTSASRAFGGTGLGTSIAKQLVDLMNGTIEVDSEPGKGSTFIFTLPFAQASDLIIPAPYVKDDYPGVNLLGNRILLVEDYPISQQIITEHLERSQAVVAVADNGKTALNLWKKNSYDLVLMDLQLPGLDGYETTRLIRQTRRGANVPIIAITADALPEVREKCRQAGLDDIITKPIQRNLLIRAVARYLGIDVPSSGTNDVPPNRKISPMDDLSEDMKKEIITGFIEQAARQFERMDGALETGDFVLLHRDAHSIKGGAMNLAEDEIAEIARNIEMKAKAMDADSVRDLLPVLKKVVSAYAEEQGLKISLS